MVKHPNYINHWFFDVESSPIEKDIFFLTQWSPNDFQQPSMSAGRLRGTEKRGWVGPWENQVFCSRGHFASGKQTKNYRTAPFLRWIKDFFELAMAAIANCKKLPDGSRWDSFCFLFPNWTLVEASRGSRGQRWVMISCSNGGPMKMSCGFDIWTGWDYLEPAHPPFGV